MQMQDCQHDETTDNAGGGSGNHGGCITHSPASVGTLWVLIPVVQDRET